MSTISRALRTPLVALAAMMTLAGCTSAIPGAPVAGAAPPPPPAEAGPSEQDQKQQTAVAELMTKIRAADVCAMHDLATLQRYATNPKALGRTFVTTGFNVCEGASPMPEANGHRFLFELTLGAAYDPREKAKDKPEQVERIAAYQSAQPAEDSCTYWMPYGETDFAAKLVARRVVVPDGQKAAWPERCQLAKEYFGRVIYQAQRLPARTKPAEDKLTGKDPCAKQEAILAEYPGWQRKSVEYASPYDCRITMAKSGEPYTMQVSVGLTIGIEPSYDSGGGQKAEVLRMGGLYGARHTSTGPMGASCADTLVIKPAGANQLETAHLLRVRAEAKPAAEPGSGGPLPAPAAEPVDKITQVVLDSLG